MCGFLFKGKRITLAHIRGHPSTTELVVKLGDVLGSFQQADKRKVDGSAAKIVVSWETKNIG